MKILSKLAVLLLFVVMMCGSFQTAGADIFPSPGSILGDYKPIPISIPSQRGADDKFDTKPQPGYDVTLLMNQKVHFAWDNSSAKKFVIKDDKGQKIFESAVGKESSLDIVPGDVKLKAGQKYSWSIDGDSTALKFTVLDEQSEKELLKKFAEIDAKTTSQEECAINKSIYVQELSDRYAELDLYWLSAQWLSAISPTDEKLVKEKNYLLEKCAKHLLIQRVKAR